MKQSPEFLPQANQSNQSNHDLVLVNNFTKTMIGLDMIETQLLVALDIDVNVAVDPSGSVPASTVNVS